MNIVIYISLIVVGILIIILGWNAVIMFPTDSLKIIGGLIAWSGTACLIYPYLLQFIQANWIPDTFKSTLITATLLSTIPVLYIFIICLIYAVVGIADRLEK